MTAKTSARQPGECEKGPRPEGLNQCMATELTTGRIPWHWGGKNN